MDSLDLYFSRRKETQHWLIVALSVGLAIAVTARIPALIVSLPLTWITGGLSIAFLWVAAPPVLWFFHAIAFNSLSEAHRARKVAENTARKQRESSSLMVTAPTAATLGDDSLIELQPTLNAVTPPALFLLHGTLWLAPVIVNCVLFGSYLQFVRPGHDRPWKYPSRAGQEVDALVGLGGWNWFQPLAPSLQSNLANLAAEAKGNEADKYKALQNQIPYVFFPIETWIYLAGICWASISRLALCNSRAVQTLPDP